MDKVIWPTVDAQGLMLDKWRIGKVYRALRICQGWSINNIKQEPGFPHLPFCEMLPEF